MASMRVLGLAAKRSFSETLQKKLACIDPPEGAVEPFLVKLPPNATKADASLAGVMLAESVKDAGLRTLYRMPTPKITGCEIEAFGPIRVIQTFDYIGGVTQTRLDVCGA